MVDRWGYNFRNRDKRCGLKIFIQGNSNLNMVIDEVNYLKQNAVGRPNSFLLSFIKCFLIFYQLKMLLMANTIKCQHWKSGVSLKT